MLEVAGEYYWTIPDENGQLKSLAEFGDWLRPCLPPPINFFAALSYFLYLPHLERPAWFFSLVGVPLLSESESSFFTKPFIVFGAGEVKVGTKHSDVVFKVIDGGFAGTKVGALTADGMDLNPGC